MSEQTLTLMGGGDIGPMVQPVTRLAELVTPALEAADFRFGQCERTYSERGFYPEWMTIPGGLWSRLPQDYAEVFREAGIDVVSLASNHTLDWSYEPMFDTIDLFRSWGLDVVGAGHDAAEARRPAILERNGVKVAVLAYCSVLREGQSAHEATPGVAAIRVRTWYEPVDFQPGSPPLVRTEALPADVEAAQEDIRAAKEIADAVVVSVHWGIRHVPKVLAEYQEPVGHALMDAGADVILGHHAHTPKAVEEYGQSLCFYSIGNFMTTGRQIQKEQPSARWGIYWFERDREAEEAGSIYGFPAHCRHAILPKLTFSDQGLVRASVVPVRINNLAQPEPLKRGDDRYDETLDYLEWVSSEHPHTFVPEDEEIVLRG